MRHQPHLLIEGPWGDAVLAISDATKRHIDQVLHVSVGSPITYTDGAGTLGAGTWSNTGVARGAETKQDPQVPAVTLAVAPPKSKDRQRSIVEKAQELGVERLLWLETEHSQVRPVSAAKASAWVRGALEQSRGAWLMEIGSGFDLADLPNAVVLDAGAENGLSSVRLGATITLAIGPEGGFSPTELESASVVASLPANILRTDTAATVAVATVLNH